MASATYESARSTPGVEMAYAIDLSFPAFDDLPEKVMRLGTRTFDLNNNEYQSALPDVPFVRQQRGVAQDTADFQLNDPNGLIYDELKPYEDVIEDTKVTIKECLKTSLGLFESETTLEGYLERLSLSESDMRLNLSAVSDMSRTGFPVGGRILTARYCGAKFNVNGLRDPEFDPCGWVTLLGGNATFCTHKRTGTDGCSEHGNLHRYFAVEALASAQVTYTPGAGGWGYGGGYICFAPMTLIRMGDGGTKPICKIKKGDIVMSWDEDDRPVRGRVGDAERMKSVHDMHMNVDFGRGRVLAGAAEHCMRINSKEFKALGGIYPGEPMQRFDTDKGLWKDVVYLNDHLVEKRSRLHNFHVEKYENYRVVVGDLDIGVSNNKPFTDIPE